MTEQEEDIFQNELKRLFKEAQEKDEFEYVCALINYGGSGDQRALNHLHESQKLLRQFLKHFSEADDLHSKTRIMLVLYCHIFEMNEFYNVIGNMLRIVLGERFAPWLYDSSLLKKELKPANKIDKLKSLAVNAGFEKLTNVISSLYSSPLRNAVFHSSYSLVDNDFYIVTGKEFRFGNCITRSVDIKKFIIPITQSTINIAGIFFNLFNNAPRTYKANKIVRARLQPGGCEIEIIGDPTHGLRGVRSVM